MLGEDERPGWTPAADRDGPPPPRPLERLGADSICAILHTSGTTGRPKAIPLTNGALIRSLAGFAIEIGDMVAGSPQLQLMPMFHLAGLSQALQCLLTGGTLHVLAAFDATRVVDEIERNAIQFFTAAPTIIAALIDEVRGRPERPTLGSLREIQYGAAPMPEPLLRDAIEVLGCRFRQIYGMTEAQSFVASSIHATTFLVHHACARRDRWRSAGRSASSTTPATTLPSAIRASYSSAAMPCSPATTAIRTRRPRRSPRTAGTAPVTSARSTTTATSRSSIGPRTW